MARDFFRRARLDEHQHVGGGVEWESFEARRERPESSDDRSATCGDRRSLCAKAPSDIRDV
jgi:hypothetical protein